MNTKFNGHDLKKRGPKRLVYDCTKCHGVYRWRQVDEQWQALGRSIKEVEEIRSDTKFIDKTCDELQVNYVMET